MLEIDRLGSFVFWFCFSVKLDFEGKKCMMLSRSSVWVEQNGCMISGCMSEPWFIELKENLFLLSKQKAVLNELTFIKIRSKCHPIVPQILIMHLW